MILKSFVCLNTARALVLLAGGLLPAWSQPSLPLNPVASRAVGQPNLTAAAPNSLEGREFYLPQAVWIDVTQGAPILYAADAVNNRVLAWRDINNAANGSKADLVLGQRDFVTNAPLGPGTNSASGFRRPTGLVTDSAGNLYVADAGNNRILRFPAPFSQPADFIQADLVIGQRSLNERQPNQGLPLPTESSVAFSLQFRGEHTVGMAIDARGNLWVTDGFNNRVLRFPASLLTPGRFGPAADLVLGAENFSSVSESRLFEQNAVINKRQIHQPSGVALDARGRVYVRDWAVNFSRVLVWDTDRIATGREASRIVGLPPARPSGAPAPTTIEFQMATVNDLNTPNQIRGGLFVNNLGLFVPDHGFNRIMRFDAFETWPAETPERTSPPAREVIGQNNFDLNSIRANRGNPSPTVSGLNYPSAVFVTTADMWIADTFNNRLISLPLAGGVFGNATRVLGQDRFDQSAPNLADGREMYLADGVSGDREAFGRNGLAGSCVAVDGDALYVADSQNNRVLGYRDLRALNGGVRADIVIGQIDFSSTSINFPTGDANQVTAQGLFNPTCVAVDAEGSLWVADSGNGRVLRYPRPFEQPLGNIRPNLVLGQTSFTLKSTDPTSRTMRFPSGIAFLSDGTALVADYLHNRVLRFRKPGGGDFQNGQAADGVVGQANFTDTATATRTDQLNRFLGPRGIATDADDRLYVADVQPRGPGRVMIFSELLAPGNLTNTSARQTLDGAGNPQGVTVNKNTGEIWIASTANSRISQLSRFEEILVTGVVTTIQDLASPAPLGLGLDRLGNVIVADSFNRVALYYPRMTVRAAVPSARNSVAPSSQAVITSWEQAFGDTTRSHKDESPDFPVPTALADVRIQFGDQFAPVMSVAPGRLNFVVPNSAPPSTIVDVTVTRVSSGQVLAAGSVQVESVSPVIFTDDETSGRGQVNAVNEDGKKNSATDAAPRNTPITVYATGYGLIPNAPADGMAAAGDVTVPGSLQVVIGTGFVPRDHILSSKLVPGMVGVWGITVRIPNTVAPNNRTPFGILFRDTPAQAGLTIAVRQ